MAIAKVILNNEVLMDVTSNTNITTNMLNGVVGTKNDGTSVTGNIATKSAANLYTSTTSDWINIVTPAGYYSTNASFGFPLRSELIQGGANITAQAGYYSENIVYTVNTGSAFPPAVTITKNPTFSMNSSTGVVTASYTGSSSITPTVNAGYISQGTAGTISTTGTSTFALTSKAAGTYYPSTVDQTISSYRWLTGSQTIKSVVTSNLIAANIAEGVVVKIGDATNDSRITQITGTHVGGTKYTATFETTIARTRIYYNGSTYYGGTPGSFDFSFGDTCGIECYGSMAGGTIWENGISIGTCDMGTPYTYTMPSNNFTLSTTGTATGRVDITFPTISITENGVYNVRDYTLADVDISPIGAYSVDEIAMRTISGSISGSATQISPWAFGYCSSLTAANFSACTSIGYSAFANCSGLTTISFPACTSIGSSAFTYCYNLTTVSFPACTSISAYAFNACYSLTTANFSACISLSSRVFYRCWSLTTVNFPACKLIGQYAFAECYALTTVSFPACTSINSYAFNACSSLTAANFSACTSIGSYAFQSCYHLLSLYLLGSSVASLLAVNAFSSTPISNYTTSTGGVYGSIFVPSSLYNTYITATNWATYSSRIVSM